MSCSLLAAILFGIGVGALESNPSTRAVPALRSVRVPGSALTGQGPALPAPSNLATAEAGDFPPNLIVTRVFQSSVNRMWRYSETFRRQCRRLAGTDGLQVTVYLSDPQYRPSFRARTVFERRDAALVAAHIVVVQSPDVIEVVAHEVEHILEQLDGVDLARQVGSGLVWRTGTNAFETRRAIEAGRRVASEVQSATLVARHGR